VRFLEAAVLRLEHAASLVLGPVVAVEDLERDLLPGDGVLALEDVAPGAAAQLLADDVARLRAIGLGHDDGLPGPARVGEVGGQQERGEERERGLAT
jgi:hypothetical protein